MKQFVLTSLLTILMSMVGAKTYAHDIEAKNADGVTIYYNWANFSRTQLYVSYRGTYYYYSNEYTGSVVIPESVTYNGNTYSVTSIGSEAFRDCTGLTSITIPNSVTSIGNRAFEGCSGLTSVTIGNNVMIIGKSAFEGCSGLTSVNVSVTDLAVFCNNEIVALIANEIEKPIIKLIDSKGYEITEYNIPNSVTRIGGSAFRYCSGLTSVTIPNSVTSIGNCAFQYTTLKSVTIGSGVLYIGYSAFSIPTKVIWLTNTPPEGYSNAVGTVNYVSNDTYGSLSNKMVYPFLSSLFEVDGVRYVPVSPSERTCDAIDCAYNESTEIINIGKSVSYKGINMTVKNANKYTCYQNSFIKEVKLAFEGDLGNYAFSGCTNLTTATLGESITSISSCAFDGCKSLQSIVIPNAVTSLGDYAFKNCSRMTSAKIGSGVTSIGLGAFINCSRMTSVKIGSSVTSIKSSAFGNCSSLQMIEIPQSVTKIEDYAFDECKSLKDVIMADRKADDTALTLGSNHSSPIFADCPLDSVYIGRNISYSTNSNKGYSPFYRNTSLRSVTITDKETEISENEFYGCSNLKNVRIGDGVITIGNWAFSGCSSLDYFSFGSSVTTIGKEAFSDCTAMTRLISHAATPPTCGTQALDDINKWNCTLSVPKGMTAAYQQAIQWKEFFFINDDVTKIGSLTKVNSIPSRVYDLNGRKQDGMKPGLNIIKMSDGKTKKVMVK